MKFYQRIWYIIIHVFFLLIGIMPRFLQRILALIVFVIIAYIVRYRRKVIIQNLSNSFPEKDKKELNLITRKYYVHMAYMMIENMALCFTPKKKIAARLTYKNIDIVNNYRRNNKSILVVMGHLGNYEYGGNMAGFFNYKSAAIYKKLSSPIFDKYFYNLRTKMGVIPVEMHHVLRCLIEFKRSDEPFILFSGADQSPMKNDINYWLTFLNQETGVFLGPEKLSIKFDLPVVYCEMRRTGYDKFEINFQLITDTPKETKEYEITNKFFELLESSIRDQPDNWLWSHRRWKHRRPETQQN